MVQDLVSDDPDHLEGLLRRDRVHEHISMDPNEMLGVQHAVFILERACTSQHPACANSAWHETEVPELLPGLRYPQSPSRTPDPCT